MKDETHFIEVWKSSAITSHGNCLTITSMENQLALTKNLNPVLETIAIFKIKLSEEKTIRTTSHQYSKATVA